MKQPDAEASQLVLGAVPAGPVNDFAAAVLRRVESPPAGPDIERWVASVKEAFKFVDERRSGSAIRVLLQGGVALDGARPRGSLIQVACEDREFIVTSLSEELRRLGLHSTRFFTVSFGGTRNDAGDLVSVGAARGASQVEGFVEIELDARLEPQRSVAVVNDLRRVMAAVFQATDDYAAMRAQILEAAEQTGRFASPTFAADEVAESVSLIEWLLDGNCVLLGTGRFPVIGTADDGTPILGPPDSESTLGLMADGDSGLCQPPTLVGGQLLDVSRLPELSIVHRQLPLERFDLRLIDESGQVAGVGRLVCVFSRRAEASGVEQVPLLRWKLQRVLADQDAVQGGFDEQSVVQLFQALPKDVLFGATADELGVTIRALLAEDRDHRVRVLMQGEPEARAVVALVTMPSELYTRSMRLRVERFLLAQLDGNRVDIEVSMGGSSDTVARFLVHLPAGVRVPDDLGTLSREVQLLCRTWEQQVVAAASEALDPEGANRLVATWADRLPPSYRDEVEPRDATDDLLALDRLAGLDAGAPELEGAPEIDDEPRMRVRFAQHPGSELRLTVVSRGEGIELSRLVPILESLGLWVIDELHWAITGGGEGGNQEIGLWRLSVRRSDGQEEDVAANGDRLSDAVVSLWTGRADVDSLNRLVTAAAMDWREVAVLRAYRRYRRQVDTRYGESYVDDVLVEHAEISRRIVELFMERLGPAGSDLALAAESAKWIGSACDQVARLDHDRILRGIAGTVSATLRTNLATRPEGPLVLKLDPAAVPDMPDPVPYREIFVHGPTVEGVHLRGGPVARGGLRHSDRPEDYRTEVLDLMRTQVLKNALIVPTGAKGGFITRGSPAPGVDRGTAVRLAYETFVSGLLDVTDDLRGAEVLATPGRLDGDDPYLVVAADKGTAAFSDLANRIALDRGFWLGDAFASGGSVGYDHRALGITARGAWVAVARHFRELGVDVQTEPFTVVGVGDMSGDVFGNGMLLSDQIRLLAAFDHRDIFLDPSPDSAASIVERRRLHNLAGSSWQDFDLALISEGGGIYPRSSKRIELSPQVREALRVTGEAMTPAELMQAILCAPADLLYLGGVGTYVRATTEANSSIDDRANAEIRISADLLRARVVGEGANLGFTQRARIEYARRGGRLNMDAIDNSAGVDTSDHEVNIKILVDLAVETGELLAADRAELLASATSDVVAAVLRDSADQCDALQRSNAASALELDAFESTQSALVSEGILDPAVEALPDAAEYEARRKVGAGLTRPELAVLLAGAKRQMKASVLGSELPDSTATDAALAGYFPGVLATRFRSLLPRHRLRRELIASEIANDIVDHLGPTFAPELATEADVEVADVAAAYWVARGVVGAPEFWDGLTEGGSGEAGEVLCDLLEQLTRREVFHRRRLLLEAAEHDVSGRIAADQPVFAELRANIAALDRPAAQRARDRLVERLTSTGSPASEAEQFALLADLVIAPDVAALARDSKRAPMVVAPTLLELSESLGIDALLSMAQGLRLDDSWARTARQGLIDDLLGLRREATRHAIEASPGGSGTDIASLWLAERSEAVTAATEVLGRLTSDDSVGLDGLSVAVRSLRRVVA